MLKKCKKCGKNFETKRAQQIYCSAECREIKQSKKKCIACGKEFEPAFSGEKFCSESCRIKFWRL